MKKRKLFVFALASLMMIGCSDNDVIDEGGGDGGEIKGDAWLSLDISTTSRTRALHDPDQENGTEDETKVNNGQAILFDASDKVVSIIPLSSNELGTPGQSTGTRGKAFKVDPNAKKILVVINEPSSAAFAPQEDQDYTTVNAAILDATVTEVTGGSTYNSFTMTNARGTLEPATGNLPLKKTEEEANNSPFAITVDRVTAKVRVYAKNATSSATIEEPKWVLNVTNKKYFPVSKRTKTQLEINFDESRNPNKDYIWSDPYKLGSYREDPNYVNTSTYPSTEYDKEYNYFTEAKQPTSTEWKDPTDAPNIDDEQGESNKKTPVEYCFENTQNAAGNVHAYTTHVLFKAQFLPKGLKANPDEETGTVNVAKDQDWIIVNGGYYTYDTVLEFMRRELKNKYLSGNPITYKTPMTDIINDYIEAVLGTSKRIAIPTSLGSYSDADAAAKDIIEDRLDAEGGNFTARKADIEGSPKKAGIFKNVQSTLTYYASGVSYYKIMIKHANNDAIDFVNQLGEFGVVRNSVYDVKINSINNPGYPIIPDPDPTPDENDELWLSIQIDINPWTWYTQVEDL